jgi:hypothetical protein
MECRFQAGDCVVCVNAKPKRGKIYYLGEHLTEGAIYTVARVNRWRHEIHVHLREVPRHPLTVDSMGADFGFDARRFRPAEDIEQFRRIVATAPREKVDA